ncbi:MAG: cytochrome c maturation protein CcmE [Ignavibacteria bacterium]|nr:MAG: cytochrome c maturation protein CcmE [Ignavibacteria bacterium]
MKSKYIFGGIIIVVFLGLMGYLLTQTNISYENDFVQVMNSKKTIKATGAWVKEKSYTYDKENNILSFYMRDDSGTEMKVVYKGSMPNNFESATSMVVTGKYKNGVFQASDILTKCPSKYEETYNESSNS